MTIAALAAALSGCAISGGVAGTHTSGGVPSVLAGPSLEAQLQLPTTWRMVGGLEWTRSDTQADLWRLGAYGGWSSPPAPGRWLGWEATARAGLLRGWDGPSTRAGGFAGAHLAALLRLGPAPQPWESDSLIDFSPLVVLGVGVNEVVSGGRPAATELAARVLLRFQLGSTLIP